MLARPVNIAIVGLGFGAEFIPIYTAHPRARVLALCQRTESKLNDVADRFDVPHRYIRFEDVLQDDEIDAIHINSPIPDHGWMSIAALKAGKHVMCTVPMATTVDECRTICELVEETGLTYMMAETVVYSREFMFLKELVDSGQLGRIQFVKASHPQDMNGWPEYWRRMAPMHYATHVVSPVLAMMDGRAELVSCFGSGRVREEIAEASGNRFAVESCHIKIKDSDVCAQIWRFLFDTARQYRESIDVYGSKKSFEWTLVQGEPHIMHTAGVPESEIPAAVTVPDFANRLPEPLRRFTGTIENAEHLSFVQGSGHGGAHPHLVHAFVRALTEARAPWPNAREAANWTCVGILAHDSAMQGGELVPLPAFTLE